MTLAPGTTVVTLANGFPVGITTGVVAFSSQTLAIPLAVRLPAVHAPDDVTAHAEVDQQLPPVAPSSDVTAPATATTTTHALTQTKCDTTTPTPDKGIYIHTDRDR